MSRSYSIAAIALLASLHAGLAGQSCAAGDASCESRDMDVNALLQSAVRVQSMLGTDGDEDDALALGQQKPKCIPLCDKTIVEDGCLFFNAGSDLEGNTYVTNPATLATFLSTTEPVIKGALEHAGLSTDKVKCMDICNAVVTYIKGVTTLPPCTDRACYHKPPKSTNVECDLDVSPETLAAIKLTTADGDMPNRTRGDIIEAGDKTGLGEVSASRSRIQRLQSNVSGEHRATPHNVTYNAARIVDRVANTFRIYPVPDMGANDSSFIEIKSSKSTNEESLRSTCHDNIGRDHALSKAYVDHVISNIQIDRQRGAASEMQTWFGRTTAATSTEVSRVLAAVDSMLTSIRYSYPGPRCAAGVYGYVYPTAYTGCTVSQIEDGRPCTSDYEGKKVVYLCTNPGVYCSVPDGEKIETILHEASHHEPAATDDVPPNPYGRYTCKQMAINSPEKSIKNADSFCYYAYDVATKVGTLPPSTGTTTPRPTTIPGPTTPASMTVAQGNCVLGTTGCVTSTNYPSNYPDREECDITVVTPGKLQALDFATERSFDKLTINGEVFSGHDKGPLDTYLQGNAVQGSIKWVSDGSNPHRGWVLCPEGVTTPTTTTGPTAPPGPPVTWNLKAGSGRGCVKDAVGCIMSDGYPGQYSDYLNCEIEVTVAGELSVEAFNTERGYDKLTVNGNELSGDDINAVKTSLEGTTINVQTITWAADSSQTRTGWKLCPKGPTTASTTPTPATTSTVTPAPTTTPTPATTSTVTPAPTTTPTPATTSTVTPAPTTTPTPATTSTVTPAPTTPPVTWNLKAGSGRGCVKNDVGCMMSDGYPGTYSNNLNCEIEVTVAGELSVEAFNTERGYDKLTVNGNELHGDDINAIKGSLEGTTINVQTITWAADSSVTKTGWKLCPKGSTTMSTTPTPATTPTVPPATTPTVPPPATTPTVLPPATTTATTSTPGGSCPNSNGIIGYMFSHAGGWLGCGNWAPDPSVCVDHGLLPSDQSCAAKCNEYSYCVGFSRGPPGNCHLYSSISDPSLLPAHLVGTGAAYAKCFDVTTTVVPPPATTPTLPPPATTPTVAPPATTPTVAPPATTPTVAPPATTPTVAPPATTPTLPPPATTTATTTIMTTPAVTSTVPPPATTPTVPPPPTTTATTAATTASPPAVVTVGRIQVQQALQQLAVDQDFLNMMMWKLAGAS